MLSDSLTSCTCTFKNYFCSMTPQTDLWIPLDDVVRSSAKVKDRLALGIKQHSLGWHEACYHYKEGSVR